MAIEVGHVEQHWEDDETKRSSREVLEEVQKVLGGVPENLPQLTDGKDADVEDNEKADKLDGDGA